MTVFQRCCFAPTGLSSSFPFSLLMIPLFFSHVFSSSFIFFIETGYGATDIEWMHMRKKHKTIGVFF
jgi:hypothetical protein